MEADGRETAAGYKGMFPKRAGKPEPGDAPSGAEDGARVRSKNEAPPRAYSRPSVTQSGFGYFCPTDFRDETRQPATSTTGHLDVDT